MKDPKKKHAIDELPTFIPTHKKRFRFVLTIVLTVVICTTLIAGGFISYFNLSSSKFMTVDGKEILNGGIVERMNSQIASYKGISPQEKMSFIMRTLSSLRQEAVYQAYASKKGIDFSTKNLAEALLKDYNDQKNDYEKKFNSRFPLDYKSFVENQVESFNKNVFLKSVTAPITVDDLSINSEYAAINTRSKVSYQYLSLEDYLTSQTPKDLSLFYENSTSKPVNSKTLLVKEFSNMKKAYAFKDSLEKDRSLIQKAFKDNLKITLTDKDKDLFLTIQNYQINKITSPFSYKGKVYVGKVLATGYAEFKKLSHNELTDLSAKYLKSISVSQKNKLELQVKRFLEKNKFKLSSKKTVKSGTTEFTNVARTNDVKDSMTGQPLPFGSIDNNSFFEFAFKPVGTTSPLLTYKNVFYKIKVVEKEKPSFPISNADRQNIVSSIQAQESRMWDSFYTNEMKDLVKIEVDYKNLQKLFNL